MPEPLTDEELMACRITSDPIRLALLDTIDTKDAEIERLRDERALLRLVVTAAEDVIDARVGDALDGAVRALNATLSATALPEPN